MNGPLSQFLGHIGRATCKHQPGKKQIHKRSLELTVLKYILCFQDADPDFTDLLICIGTSLEVYPFANLADLVPDNVVRILINRDTVGSFGKRKSDIILNGDIVDIVHKLEKEINW